MIGGGIAGITTALLCKRDGARVAVIERGQIAGGATGFTTAKASALQQTKLAQIRKRHDADTAAAYAAASTAALDWIEREIGERQIDCGWERLPDVTYALDEQQVESVEQTAEAARAAGLPVRVTTARAELPLPFDVPAAVVLDGQAQFHPVRYVRALAAQVAGDDCHLFERTAVVAVEEGTPCTVTTDDGRTIHAGDVVVCTNYPLLDRGLFFARMEAARSYLVAARLRDDAALPQAMAISAGEPTRSIRPYRDRDGTPWLLVGGEGHLTGSDEARPGRYEALERFARDHWPVDADRLPLVDAGRDAGRQPAVRRPLHAALAPPVGQRRPPEVGDDERDRRRPRGRRPDRRPRRAASPTCSTPTASPSARRPDWRERSCGSAPT